MESLRVETPVVLGHRARGVDRRNRRHRVARGPAGPQAAERRRITCADWPGMAHSRLPNAWPRGRARSETAIGGPPDGKDGKSQERWRGDGVLSPRFPRQQQTVPVQEIGGERPPCGARAEGGRVQRGQARRVRRDGQPLPHTLQSDADRRSCFARRGCPASWRPKRRKGGRVPCGALAGARGRRLLRDARVGARPLPRAHERHKRVHEDDEGALRDMVQPRVRLQRQHLERGVQVDYGRGRPIP